MSSHCVINLEWLLITRIVKPAAGAFSVQPHTARYWRNKFQNENFHSNTHRRVRQEKFSNENFNNYATHLWNIAKENPDYHKTLLKGLTKTIIFKSQKNM